MGLLLSFREKRKKQRKAKVRKKEKTASRTNGTHNAGAVCGIYGASSFFSGEKKEAKKSETRKKKRRRHAQTAPKLRVPFAVYTGILLSFREKRKKQRKAKVKKKEKTASYTDGTQTAGAACGERWLRATNKKAYPLTGKPQNEPVAWARFVPKMPFLPFLSRLSSLFLSSFSRKKKEKNLSRFTKKNIPTAPYRKTSPSFGLVSCRRFPFCPFPTSAFFFVSFFFLPKEERKEPLPHLFLANITIFRNIILTFTKFCDIIQNKRMRGAKNKKQEKQMNIYAQERPEASDDLRCALNSIRQASQTLPEGMEELKSDLKWVEESLEAAIFAQTSERQEPCEECEAC